MTASAMKSGLILGVLFSFNFLISLTGIPFISWLIFGVIIYMTYRITIEYRDKEAGGSLSYGQSFMYIFFTYFFAALISAFVKFVFYQFISPNGLNELYNQTITILEGNSALFPEDMLDQVSGSLKSLLRPAPYALYSLFANMIGAVFAGLIIAAFTKKEKSVFEKDNTSSENN